MENYMMVVFTNPIDNRDDEFNKWYDEQHLDDLLAMPGMKTAQRYRLTIGSGWKYMAIYDVETDDLDGLMVEMFRRVKDNEIIMSPAFNENYMLVAGNEIGNRHYS